MAKQKKYVSRDPNSPLHWTWREKVEAVAKKVDEAKAERAVAASAMTQKPKAKGWEDEGRKDDADKLPWHLLPGDALEEVVKVLQFGAVKYGEHNWAKGMRWSRPWSALMRHAWAWWRGQDKDPETGLSHMAHCCCCVLFILAFEKRKVGTDDRV